MQKVSIITPVYNGEKYIKRCIKSVLSQTYTNIKHYVINDGSTDDTMKLCEQFQDKRLKIINTANGGVSKARNIALKKINSEYVMFLDADDWLEQNTIELMVNKIEKDGSDIVVCAFNNYYENSNKFELIPLHDKHGKLLSNILDESTNFGGYPWNKLLRFNIIKNIYNTDVHYYENLLFFVENTNDKMKYSMINEPLYNYCINDGSALHSKKYSIKKLTQLDALLLIIPKIPSNFKSYYEYLFIANYYENLFNIKCNDFNNKCDILKFKSYLKCYYHDVMISKNVDVKKKMKIFVAHRLNFIYFLSKKIKGAF